MRPIAAHIHRNARGGPRQSKQGKQKLDGTIGACGSYSATIAQVPHTQL